MTSLISTARAIRSSFLVSSRYFGTSGIHRQAADVTPPSDSNRSSATPPSDKVGFDSRVVEDLILKASRKDMPIDMTNPYEKKKVQCMFCKYNLQLDYKNVKFLSQFVSSFTGNVYEKHITGLCQEQQDRLVKTIMRSRNSGFMPKLFKKVEFFKDPKLFDPNNPIKPHPH